jgi:hypothetical protein
MDRNEPSIPERVRAQLLALGIPAAKHHAQALASFFPDEFNIGATALTTEEMANVLIYFAEKKLVSISGSGGLTAVTGEPWLAFLSVLPRLSPTPADDSGPLTRN